MPPRRNAHSDYYTKTCKWYASTEKYRRIWISTGCKAKVDIESEIKRGPPLARRPQVDGRSPFGPGLCNREVPNLCGGGRERPLPEVGQRERSSQVQLGGRISGS